jgi:hypothetical protein
VPVKRQPVRKLRVGVRKRSEPRPPTVLAVIAHSAGYVANPKNLPLTSVLCGINAVKKPQLEHAPLEPDDPGSIEEPPYVPPDGPGPVEEPEPDLPTPIKEPPPGGPKPPGMRTVTPLRSQLVPASLIGWFGGSSRNRVVVVPMNTNSKSKR